MFGIREQGPKPVPQSEQQLSWKEALIIMEFSRRDFGKLALAGLPFASVANTVAAETGAGPNIKGWSCMDHWSASCCPAARLSR